MFSIIILFFFYVNFISTSNAKHPSCDKIVKNYLITNEGIIGEKWEHYDVMNNIKKKCIMWCNIFKFR